jgi:hypothetical protein
MHLLNKRKICVSTNWTVKWKLNKSEIKNAVEVQMNALFK